MKLEEKTWNEVLGALTVQANECVIHAKNGGRGKVELFCYYEEKNRVKVILDAGIKQWMYLVKPQTELLTQII